MPEPQMPDSTDLNDVWIEAIHDDRLSELDDPAAAAVCEAIGSRMATEVQAVEAALRRAGVALESAPIVPTRMQRHAAELVVADAAHARRAAAVLEADGFDVWEPTSRGAGRVHARCRNVHTLARTTDVTVAIRIRWPQGNRRLPSAVVPNQADYALIDLPGPLWALYFLVRPLRLALERLHLRTPAPPVLGPFLSTPTDLIPGLLEFANVTSGDTIADLGCGDGRILVEAVTRIGCRAIGVESEPALVAAAEERARSAGVADRVRIIEGDAATAELDQATSIFVFLPADATVALVGELLARLQPGTRVIAHEQHRLPRTIPGATSVALVAGQGVTVAHQWIVGR